MVRSSVQYRDGRRRFSSRSRHGVSVGDHGASTRDAPGHRRLSPRLSHRCSAARRHSIAIFCCGRPRVTSIACCSPNVPWRVARPTKDRIYYPPSPGDLHGPAAQTGLFEPAARTDHHRNCIAYHRGGARRGLGACRYCRNMPGRNLDVFCISQDSISRPDAHLDRHCSRVARWLVANSAIRQVVHCGVAPEAVNDEGHPIGRITNALDGSASRDMFILCLVAPSRVARPAIGRYPLPCSPGDQ